MTKSRSRWCLSESIQTCKEKYSERCSAWEHPCDSRSGQKEIKVLGYYSAFGYMAHSWPPSSLKNVGPLWAWYQSPALSVRKARSAQAQLKRNIEKNQNLDCSVTPLPLSTTCWQSWWNVTFSLLITHGRLLVCAVSYVYMVHWLSDFISQFLYLLLLCAFCAILCVHCCAPCRAIHRINLDWPWPLKLTLACGNIFSCPDPTGGDTAPLLNPLITPLQVAWLF